MGKIQGKKVHQFWSFILVELRVLRDFCLVFLGAGGVCFPSWEFEIVLSNGGV